LQKLPLGLRVLQFNPTDFELSAEFLSRIFQIRIVSGGNCGCIRDIVEGVTVGGEIRELLRDIR